MKEKSLYYCGKKIYKKIKKNQELKKEIIEALKNNEFKLYIQPKYKTKTKKICGGEILIRWNKNNKIIYPKNFINKLEKNGFIYLIDIYVLKNSLKILQELEKKYSNKIKISINQSQRNLLHYAYINLIKKIIKENKLKYNILEIELTEGIFVNTNKVKKLENELHNLNVLVSIDDFGTGYSSYYLLSEINIDILKLDKKLFDNLENKKSKTIAKAIIKLTKKLKIKTVAEGIENKKQYKFVKKAKCDEIQGYYFSKPITLNEFEKKLNKKNK